VSEPRLKRAKILSEILIASETAHVDIDEVYSSWPTHEIYEWLQGWGYWLEGEEWERDSSLKRMWAEVLAHFLIEIKEDVFSMKDDELYERLISLGYEWDGTRWKGGILVKQVRSEQDRVRDAVVDVERKVRFEIARNLLREDAEPGLTAKVTGLSAEQLEQIYLIDKENENCDSLRLSKKVK